MSTLASTATDLARIQFAMTSLYHFLFVPLTLGLAPLVAIMQTAWHRTGNEAWLRLTRFFGTLLLINFAIGVATGLVQEFQFGMNWSVYSRVRRQRLRRAARHRGPRGVLPRGDLPRPLDLRLEPPLAAPAPGDHLARRPRHVAVGVLHPRRQLVDAAPGRLRAEERPRRADQRLGADHQQVRDLGLRPHDPRRRHGRRRRRARRLVLALRARAASATLFLRSAKLALIVLVPVSAFNLLVRQQLRHRHDRAPADEDRGRRRRSGTRSSRPRSRCSRSAASPGRPDAVVLDRGPGLLSFLATGTFDGEVQGLNQLQQQEEQQYGSGNYIPPVRTAYWAMR